MPVPNHGPSCRTSIWRTQCKDCSKEVYFFSCTCGSKVLFNLAEPPWNPHEDSCFPYQIRLAEGEGRTVGEIRDLVDKFAFRNRLEIPLEVHKLLVRLDRKSRNEIYIDEISAEDFPEQVFGEVLKIHRDANFFKRFSLANNSVGKGLLGKLAKRSFSEVIVREEVDEQTRFSLQYTFFVQQDLLDRRGIAQNMFVLADLEPYELVGRGKIWLAADIRRGQGEPLE